MEKLLNGILKEVRSAFLLKSERSLQTIINGEIVTIQEGDKISFIVAKVEPESEMIVGFFNVNDSSMAVEYPLSKFSELISELIISTAKTI